MTVNHQTNLDPGVPSRVVQSQCRWNLAAKDSVDPRNHLREPAATSANHVALQVVSQGLKGVPDGAKGPTLWTIHTMNVAP